MIPTGTTAAIVHDPEWDRVALVERRRWTVALSLGPSRRRHVDTRREAIAWCEELGLPYVIAPPIRPRSEYLTRRA